MVAKYVLARLVTGPARLGLPIILYARSGRLTNYERSPSLETRGIG